MYLTWRQRLHSLCAGSTQAAFSVLASQESRSCCTRAVLTAGCLVVHSCQMSWLQHMCSGLGSLKGPARTLATLLYEMQTGTAADQACHLHTALAPVFSAVCANVHFLWQSDPQIAARSHHRRQAGNVQDCTVADSWLINACVRQALERRNIHIKRFEEIPIADTELIFPDKTIFLKPLTILQLAVTLIGGLVAALTTLWGVGACRQFCHQRASLMGACMQSKLTADCPTCSMAENCWFLIIAESGQHEPCGIHHTAAGRSGVSGTVFAGMKTWLTLVCLQPTPPFL